MKTKFYPILLCAALCACGGGNAKQPVADVETTKDTMQVTKGVSKPGGIPVLDVNKKYPKKSFCIQDIADVEYVPLGITDDMLWLRRELEYMDENYIIGANAKTGVMVHNRQGKPSIISIDKEEAPKNISLCSDYVMTKRPMKCSSTTLWATKSIYMT